MKKIITIMMVLVLVVALAVPALAANEITADEQKVYDEFAAVVDKWEKFSESDNAEKAKSHADQYKTEATNGLKAAELDKAACDDLIACVKAVDEFIASKNPQRGRDLLALTDDVCKLVNETSNKYGITVTLDDGIWAKVFVKNPTTGEPEPVTPDKPVKQTGFDITNTIVVAVILAVALIGSAVVIGKKRLAANN